MPGRAIYVRTIVPDDWRLWRNLRLEALTEAPHAFSSKLADWQGAGDTEARWRERLSAMPINFVAEFNGTAAGIVSASLPDEQGTVGLISMWVAPFARGHGVGDSLVTAVIEWAYGQRATSIVLDVVVDNAPAAALYRRNGFVDLEAGTSSASGVGERQMVLYLCDSR